MIDLILQDTIPAVTCFLKSLRLVTLVKLSAVTSGRRPACSVSLEAFSDRSSNFFANASAVSKAALQRDQGILL